MDDSSKVYIFVGCITKYLNNVDLMRLSSINRDFYQIMKDFRYKMVSRVLENLNCKHKKVTEELLNAKTELNEINKKKFKSNRLDSDYKFYDPYPNHYTDPTDPFWDRSDPRKDPFGNPFFRNP